MITCQYEKCSKELLSKNGRRKWCNIQHRDMQRSLDTNRILGPGTPSFYNNYKEPLREVDKGFGFYGVVATNEEKTHVQCHECGFFYKSLQGHVQTHSLNIKEYKEKYQLSKNTALIGEALREHRIKVFKNLPEAIKDARKKTFEKHVTNPIMEGKIKTGVRSTNWSLERRNKEGLCPDQLLQKIKEHAEEIGRTPSAKEFRRKHTRFMCSIITTFGTWNNAVELAKLTPYKSGGIQKYSTIQLLEWLRQFYDEHGRVATNSDFARGYLPGATIYFNRFGSMNDARIQANIPVLIPLGNRRYVESMDYGKI